MNIYTNFLVVLIPNIVFNYINYCYLHIKCNLPFPRIRFTNPRRFNHKIIWLKRNYRHPNASLYVDKILVKLVISKLIDNVHIIETLGVWENADDINYDLLPKSFIIKTNHASGQNIIIKNKYDFDKKIVNLTLNRWLKLNYSTLGKEYQYKKIRPLILVEPLINGQDDAPLNDYKFYCFNGNPMYVQVDFDRFTEHTRNFYDMNWNFQNFSILYPNNKKFIEKPINFDKMIEIAQKLSQGFPFIRVDLYSYGNKVYFGELTFHPEGGFGPVFPDKYDYILGDKLRLPQISN